MNQRVGIGTDVHAFPPGRPCWMARLPWPDTVCLARPAEAGVAAHAACDSIFGAAGLGDLGSNFGTSRPEWSGASGAALLAASARRVREAGVAAVRVSVQVIG